MARFIITYHLSSRENVNKTNKQTKIIEGLTYNDVIAKIEEEHEVFTIKYIRNMEADFYSYYDDMVRKIADLNNTVLKYKEEELKEVEK